MPPFRLFTGNRLETLSRALADIVRVPLTSPLAPEIFVVQSSGMQRWLSMEIARHLGVSANTRFLYPNAFVQETINSVIPPTIESAGFDPEVMVWHIMKILPDCLSTSGFEEIRYYLGEGRADRKTFQLAAKIADVFDQYVVFRPDMIFKWEQGEDDSWQAVLWRRLVNAINIPHKATRFKTFCDAVRARSFKGEMIPQRITVFGISVLPPFHMNVLDVMAEISEVNLFLINPCREFWGDMLSDREIKKVFGGGSAKNKMPRSILHLEQGNRLLSDLGLLGRDFIDLVQEFDCETHEYFKDPGRGTLLSNIQSDILHLVQRSGSTGKKTIEANDCSVMVSSCHNPMREVETLYDNLLNLFNRDPSLRAGDILVMTPDIEAYAPYIQAVFDVPEDKKRHIPFSIADRTLQNESVIVRAFQLLLDLCGSRFRVSRVISLLESVPVRDKFAFTQDDVRLVSKWVDETGIRWGIDAEHRGRMGLPAFEENTWRAGLSRLILGYAMGRRQGGLFEGILPYDGLEGENALLLGRFMTFVDKLVEAVSVLEKSRTPEEWAGVLHMLLDDFFMLDNEYQRDYSSLSRAIDGLKKAAEAEFDDAVGIDVVRQHLSGFFSKQGFGSGFLEGGVTFCAMVPMRSIPFRVICLIGMNTDAYPRQTKSAGFDLTAKFPRKGDRSRRNDDQYLFLESIVSARDILYISHVGQSRVDNSSIPPAVPVSGLLEYIDDNFEIPGRTVRDHIVTHHRLQAFHPGYFGNDGPLFSYSDENRSIAEHMAQRSGDVEPFIRSSLCESDTLAQPVDLEDVIRFYSNPSAVFVQTRFGIYFDKPLSTLEEREVFSMNSLERYLIGNELTEVFLDGRDASHLVETFRAAGRLPHGIAGQLVFDEICGDARRFAELIMSMSGGEPLEALAVDLCIAGIRLTGEMGRLYPNRLVIYRNAKTTVKDRLRAWIYHIVLNCMDGGDCPDSTVFIGKNSKREADAFAFSPVENSHGILEQIIDCYRQGLSLPLCFFPETSYAYALPVVRQGKSTQEALRRARQTWEGNNFRAGESEDAYIELCFRGREPLDAEFEKTALALLSPMIINENSV